MSGGYRITAALLAASLAWLVGKALGVPVWRDWDMGDRTDMAVIAFMLVWFLTARALATPINTVEEGKGA